MGTINNKVIYIALCLRSSAHYDAERWQHNSLGFTKCAYQPSVRSLSLLVNAFPEGISFVANCKTYCLDHLNKIDFYLSIYLYVYNHIMPRMYDLKAFAKENWVINAALITTPNRQLYHWKCDNYSKHEMEASLWITLVTMLNTLTALRRSHRSNGIWIGR